MSVSALLQAELVAAIPAAPAAVAGAAVDAVEESDVDVLVLARVLELWCGKHNALTKARMLCNDSDLGFRTLAGMHDMRDADWVSCATCGARSLWPLMCVSVLCISGACCIVHRTVCRVYALQCSRRLACLRSAVCVTR